MPDVDPIELLRGIARGATADLMGGPVDLATMATNLGIKGAGWGAQKLGLIDEPWSEIDPRDVPFSSDWLAKNTPLEAPEETSEYNWGRFMPALYGLGAAGLSAAGLAGRGSRAADSTQDAITALRGGPGGKEGGALYIGKDGELGGSDFVAYHNTDLSPPGRLPRELDNLSFAVSHENNPQLLGGFGEDILVPNPKKLEPRTNPTQLHGSDAYTMRRGGSFSQTTAGNKHEVDPDVLNYMLDVLVKENPEAVQLGDDGMLNITQQMFKDVLNSNDPNMAQWEKPLLEELGRFMKGSDNTRASAIARLRNRNIREEYSKDNLRGIFGEDSGAPMEKKLKEPGALTQSGVYNQMLAREPLYQSIAEYLRSPYGGRRIGMHTNPKTNPRDIVDSLERGMHHLNNQFNKEQWQRVDSLPLEGAAKMFEQGLNPYFQMDLMSMRNPELVEQQYPWASGALARGTAHGISELFELARRSPSEYGEIKRWGPTGVNRDNFVAGIFNTRPHATSDHRDYMSHGVEDLMKRGIPSFNAEGMSQAEIFDLIEQLQTQSLKPEPDFWRNFWPTSRLR